VPAGGEVGLCNLHVVPPGNLALDVARASAETQPLTLCQKTLANEDSLHTNSLMLKGFLLESLVVS
jgi:hypothetical protein